MLENLFHVLRFSSAGVFAAQGHWTSGQKRSGEVAWSLEATGGLLSYPILSSKVLQHATGAFISDFISIQASCHKLALNGFTHKSQGQTCFRCSTKITFPRVNMAGQDPPVDLRKSSCLLCSSFLCAVIFEIPCHLHLRSMSSCHLRSQELNFRGFIDPSDQKESAPQPVTIQNMRLKL